MQLCQVDNNTVFLMSSDPSIELMEKSSSFRNDRSLRALRLRSLITVF
jgi:hypothetical protein